MNDQEFDVLEELYFTLDFDQLREEVGMEAAELKALLVGLHAKGYLKYLDKASETEQKAPLQLDTDFSKFRYVASKKGLMAHNNML